MPSTSFSAPTGANEIIQNSLDTLQRPIDHFLQTGFFIDVPAWVRRALTDLDSPRPKRDAGNIDAPTVRRICREISLADGRPFIKVGVKLNWRHADALPARYQIACVMVQAPRRKYLMEMFSPVFAAGVQARGFHHLPEAPLSYTLTPNLVAAKFVDMDVFDKLGAIWDHDEMRAIRRAPPRQPDSASPLDRNFWR